MSTTSYVFWRFKIMLLHSYVVTVPILLWTTVYSAKFFDGHLFPSTRLLGSEE